MSDIVMSKPNPLITLLTDFGTEDGYVGAMKGVIYGDLPNANVVDISHQIEPFNIRQAAFSLLNYAIYYPANTVHVVVVDPGVGTSRKALIVKTENHYFIGPDNGVFSFIYQILDFSVYEIKKTNFDRKVSHTFHGRDIFAPVAVKILKNQSLKSFAEPTNSYVSFYEQYQRFSENKLRLKVVHVDHFGNLILNFNRQDWKNIGQPTETKLLLDRGFLYGIKETFGDEKEGQVLTLWDSSGYLQIAQNKGNASQLLGMAVGDEIEVEIF